MKEEDTVDAMRETPRPKRRILPIIATLIVGIGIGFFGREPILELLGLRRTINPCIGGGVKNLTVNLAGTPSCAYAEDFAAAGDTVNWTAPPGSTLKIVFRDPNAFPKLDCNYNTCKSGLPGSSVYSTTQDYWAFVYPKGTTEPPPPTPPPTGMQLGHIIIKP